MAPQPADLSSRTPPTQPPGVPQVRWSDAGPGVLAKRDAMLKAEAFKVRRESDSHLLGLGYP